MSQPTRPAARGRREPGLKRASTKAARPPMRRVGWKADRGSPRAASRRKAPPRRSQGFTMPPPKAARAALAAGPRSRIASLRAARRLSFSAAVLTAIRSASSASG